MKESLSFDDVLLVPKYGVLSSRKDADLTAELIQGVPLGLPLVSANMPSVTGPEMAIAMWKNGGIGAIHRFQSIAEQLAEYRKVMIAGAQVIVSFGTQADWLQRVDCLVNAGATLFLLDVAHADSERTEKVITEFWNRWHHPGVHLIVGNVATYEGAKRLAYAGADAIKIGIGPGAACTTREVTGFGVPQLSAISDVQQLRHLYPDLRFIADGGCKNSGDIVKAFAAGADTVMLGRLLAGADEAPNPGVYYGNASAHQNGHRAPEGEYGVIPKTGPVEDTLKRLAWGVRSGVSYGGGSNLKDLRKVDIIKVTPLAAHESGTRL